MAPATTPSSSLGRNVSSSSRGEREAAAEAELRERIRSANHGMGAFSDSLMRDVRVLEFNEGGGRGGGVESDSNEKTKKKSTIEGLSSASPSLVLSFPVSADLCNGFETLHGGAQATAVDIFTSALLRRVHEVPSVTADLHISCLSAAPLGSTIVCVCRADRHGGTLQYSSCDLYREVLSPDDNDGNERKLVLVARGLHTKYVLENRKRGFDGGGQQRSKL